MTNDNDTLGNTDKVVQTDTERLNAINTDGLNKTMLKGYAAMLEQFIPSVEAGFMPVDSAAKVLEGYVSSNRRTRTVSTHDVDLAALQVGVKALKKYITSQSSLFNGVVNGFYTLTIPLDVCDARTKETPPRARVIAGSAQINSKTVPAATGFTWVDANSGTIRESRAQELHLSNGNNPITGQWPYANSGNLVQVPTVDIEGKSKEARQAMALAIQAAAAKKREEALAKREAKKTAE